MKDTKGVFMSKRLGTTLIIIIILLLVTIAGCQNANRLSFNYDDMSDMYVDTINDELRILTNRYMGNMALYHNTYQDGKKDESVIILDFNKAFNEVLANQVNYHLEELSREEMDIVGELLSLRGFVNEQVISDAEYALANPHLDLSVVELSDSDLIFLEQFRSRYNELINRYYK